MNNNSTSQALAQDTVLHGTQYAYTIVRVLGQGTFGITYLATIDVPGPLGDITMQVAVKEFFMKAENGRQGSQVTTGNKDGSFAYYRKRFLREARNLSQLHHPNIIKVLEAFEGNGTVYYAMEYVDGGSLDNLIMDTHGLSEADTLRYTHDIAAALQCMHDNKMLHLDLKPSNVMLREGHAVLIDFGLSKQYGTDGNPETSISIGRGTHGYAPLEQDNDMRNSGGFPVTMDVYALGATMFKMLTGTTPPQASQILNFGFPYNELLAKGVSRSLTDIVSRAMEPMMMKRTPSVAALMAQIAAIETDGNTKPTATATTDEATVVSATPQVRKQTTGTKAHSTKPTVTKPHIKADSKIDKVAIVFNEESGFKSVAKRYVVTPQQVSMVKGMPPRTLSRTLRNGEFEKFKQELQCLATCKKTGDENMRHPLKILTITLFCGQKIVKTYSVSTDDTHTYGNLSDNAMLAHIKVLNILPQRNLLEEHYERMKLAEEQKADCHKKPKLSTGNKPRTATGNNTGSATTSKPATDDDDVPEGFYKTLRLAGFGVTTAAFLFERVYKYSADDPYDIRWSFLKRFVNTDPDSLLPPLLFLAGAIIMALPLFSFHRRHPRLHAFIGSLCYGAATLVCTRICYVNFNNMMWPIAALLTIWAYKEKR